MYVHFMKLEKDNCKFNAFSYLHDANSTRSEDIILLRSKNYALPSSVKVTVVFERKSFVCVISQKIK